MSRAVASNRIGDLGITKALHLYGLNPSTIDFGAQTFLDGTPFTMGIRCWQTNSSMAADGALWSYGWQNNNNPDAGYMLRIDAASHRAYFWSGSATVTATNLRLTGKKYIFAEFDGATTLRLYDGTVLKDTLTTVPRTAHAGTSTYLGCRDTSGRFWQGVVGDGCIYNRVLTAAEKTAIVSRASYPTSGAQLLIKCNENTGSTIIDYSGNGRNGTFGSGLWRNSPFNA